MCIKMDFKILFHHTIQKFIDEDKVVLDVFLWYLTKVWLHAVSNLQQKLKNHRGIDILFGDSCNPYISTLYNDKSWINHVNNKPTEKEIKDNTLTWKNEVLAMFVTGDLTCCLAWITFTRKASTAFLPMSSRYTRDIKTSPLWLYMKRPPIILTLEALL